MPFQKWYHLGYLKQQPNHSGQAASIAIQCCTVDIVDKALISEIIMSNHPALFQGR